MKRNILFLIPAALLTIAGCSREIPATEGNSPEEVAVSVEAGLDLTATKAVSDNDGHAKKVNHWVMEVLDKDGNVFTRQERNDVAAGTLNQTFSVTLFKNNSYTFLFWADTKGKYDTDKLTAVKSKVTVANNDSLDAFSTSKAYVSKKSETISATLTRPFAQLNVQTTDLDSLWKTTRGAADRTEYDLFEPNTFKAVLSIPTTFNVSTQETGAASSVTLTAESVYKGYQTDSTSLQEHNNFYNHVNPATLFMAYILAGKDKALYDIAFSFKTNGQDVNYDFTSIPFQRNYRTNIKGKFLSNETEWTVTINPKWFEPDYDENR